MKNQEKLQSMGIKHIRTRLGEPVFIHFGDADAGHNAIRPINWSASELMAIADFMESNPDCTLMDDRSGKKVRH